MNSFMSWVGGKKALREEVVRRFPIYYERYIEVFGGGGWVLFHKDPGNDFEVYNDFNSLLVNLYRCVRDKPEELIAALRYVLNSREDFERARTALARDSPMDAVRKAALFYQIIRYSYASALTSYGSQPHDMRANFPLLEPPHRATPLPMQGTVLQSSNDAEFIRELYDAPGIRIEPVTRLNNIRQRYDPNCQFSELLIANYDMHERERASVQLNLFDYEKEEDDDEIFEGTY